mgnify:CR=1 FL=1
MQISVASQRFHDGAVSKIQAVPAVLGEGWMIQVTAKGQSEHIHTARGDVKVYSNFDSLINDVRRIAGRVSVATFSF